MRRDVRIIAATILLAGAWTGGSRVAEAVSAMDTFRVTEVDITGLETLERGQVLALMDLTGETSVWDDTELWEARLLAHPLLKEAHVERRIPGTLVVSLVERRPVALAPTPTLEPVDGDGVLLPLDPAESRMDLPLVEVRRTLPPGVRRLAGWERALVAEVARLSAADPGFFQLVSEVAWGGDGRTMVVRLGEPSVTFLVAAGSSAARLQEGLTVLGDVLDRDPGGVPAVIDLRYADQVVVRRNP
jgi:cell division protein FtsQ